MRLCTSIVQQVRSAHAIPVLTRLFAAFRIIPNRISIHNVGLDLPLRAIDSNEGTVRRASPVGGDSLRKDFLSACNRSKRRMSQSQVSSQDVLEAIPPSGRTARSCPESQPDGCSEVVTEPLSKLVSGKETGLGETSLSNNWAYRAGCCNSIVCSGYGPQFLAFPSTDTRRSITRDSRDRGSVSVAASTGEDIATEAVVRAREGFPCSPRDLPFFQHNRLLQVDKVTSSVRYTGLVSRIDSLDGYPSWSTFYVSRDDPVANCAVQPCLRTVVPAEFIMQVDLTP